MQPGCLKLKTLKQPNPLITQISRITKDLHIFRFILPSSIKWYLISLQPCNNPTLEQILKFLIFQRKTLKIISKKIIEKEKYLSLKKN